MNAPIQHRRIKTRDPHKVALAVMAKTAREAARTWTVREFAGVLAARAGPRDYVAQLRQIYDEITRRWRYVMEPDEFVHGSASSLIGHVLGTRYNAPGQDPTRVDLAKMSTNLKGWGDCDDVATAVAALAIGIGMPKVFFRISENPGGAHVSVVVETPRGERVSIDPVGHPDHNFGWAQPAQRVQLVDINTIGPAPLAGIDGGTNMQAVETYFIAPGNQLAGGTQRSHMCAVLGNDFDGPRSLTVPMRQWRSIRRGIMTDGMAGVDENNKVYKYCANRDLWIDEALRAVPNLQKPAAMGGVFEDGGRLSSRAGRVIAYPLDPGPLGRRSSRPTRKKRRMRGRKFFKRIGKGFRKVMARVLNSKWVQNVVAGVLQAAGMPMRLTKGVIAAGSKIIERGGVRAFLRLLRTDRKAAMRMIAAAGKAGLAAAGVDAGQWKERAKKRALLAIRSGARRAGMRGIEDVVPVEPELVGMGALYDHNSQPNNVGTGYWLQQQSLKGAMSQAFRVAPVVSIQGAFGIVDINDSIIAPTPTPGMWYQIDPKVARSLSKTAALAYGTSGGTNLKRQKWINQVQANQYAFDPTAIDNLHKAGKITFMPRFSADPAEAVRGVPGKHWATIWIPEREHDEPPELVTPPIPELPDPTPPPILPPPTTELPDTTTPTLPPTDPDDDTGDKDLPPVVADDDVGDPIPPTTGDPVVLPNDDVEPTPDDEIPDPIVGVGPRGPAGAAGATGPAGVAGPRGLPGVGEGSPGERGASGARGPAGPAGVPGSIGPIGPTGPTGPAGAGGTGGGTQVAGWFPVVAAAVLGGWFK